MSRIGKRPVAVPNGVTVTVNGSAITVKGPKGELSRKLHPDMQVKVENGTVNVGRPSDEQNHRALHGLTRSLIANMVEGVTQGYRKQLEITGVGYKAEVKPFGLQLALGYSHPIEFPLPPEVDAKAERLTTKGSIQQYQTTLTLSSIDKQKLGQVAAEMHRLRKPDAYKGKGVRYADRPIKLKPGKTGK